MFLFFVLLSRDGNQVGQGHLIKRRGPQEEQKDFSEGVGTLCAWMEVLVTWVHSCKDSRQSLWLLHLAVWIAYIPTKFHRENHYLNTETIAYRLVFIFLRQDRTV